MSTQPLDFQKVGLDSEQATVVIFKKWAAQEGKTVKKCYDPYDREKDYWLDTEPVELKSAKYGSIPYETVSTYCPVTDTVKAIGWGRRLVNFKVRPTFYFIDTNSSTMFRLLPEDFERFVEHCERFNSIEKTVSTQRGSNTWHSKFKSVPSHSLIQAGILTQINV